MANSPEYRVMLKKGPELRLAFQPVLLSLSELLVAEGLITEDNNAEINNNTLPSPERAARLVELIRNQVKLDPPGNYRRFYKVLQQDETQFGGIIRILNEGGVVPSQSGTASGGGTSQGAHHGGDHRFYERDHAEIYQKLSSHAHKWREIGRGLDFSKNEMDIIEHTPMLHLRGPSGYLEQLLSQWLQWAPGDERGSKGFATRESLIAGLLEVNLGVLAEKFGYTGTPKPQAESTPGNVAASSGTNGGSKEVIEMPPEYPSHVEPDSGGIEDPKELGWCVRKTLEQRKDSGQGSKIGRQTLPASLRQNRLWDLDQLNVKFLDPIPTTWTFCEGGNNLDSIMNLAKRWNRKGKHIPQIERVEYGAPAHIRVRFTESEGSQSYVGVQAQGIQPDQPTMWLNLSEDGDEYKEHVVVHEFGHALGLDHEHQRGDFWSLIKDYVDLSEMEADLKGAYESYTADLSFGASDRKTTKYDPNSVMHYWFKESWLKKNYNTEEKVQNAKISTKKKEALLGILQRSHGHLVTEPSETDLDFLDERYKKKKKSKKNGTDDRKGTHTGEQPVKKKAVQPPHGKKGADLQEGPIEEGPARRNFRQLGRFTCVIIGAIYSWARDHPKILMFIAVVMLAYALPHLFSLIYYIIITLLFS